ncbi:uracil-DNA glycosylase [Oricola thermophila]|uniref:Type-4 uracil-DNA glycosylase n=2 Tax=Oricola thermophila TaxID=2742145 RepID=A0A6N1VLA4_9HYPH|nr:uracil-DNA glycosylase [Oricola thermophila]
MSRGELESLLRFYAESGLDFPLEDEAPNRFAAETATAPTNSQESPARPPAAKPERLPAMPDAEAVALAKQLARAAESLDDLRKAVESFDGCNLKLTARSTIFEGGRRGAPMMIIQDAPGRDDDASGEALTGPEGQLFDRMLAAIGRSRDDCYMGFVVPWRVPGNAVPSPLQASICRPFIERQIELARPDFAVLLGNGATKILLDTRENILQLRGRWQELRTESGHALPVIATLQPRFLLDQPAQKRYAWTDLLQIRDRLGTTKKDA